jgi:hypothetical protein
MGEFLSDCGATRRRRRLAALPRQCGDPAHRSRREDQGRSDQDRTDPGRGIKAERRFRHETTDPGAGGNTTSSLRESRKTTLKSSNQRARFGNGALPPDQEFP